MHDTTASYKFLPTLPANSIVIGDKGYISGKLESFLAKFGIELLCTKNVKIWSLTLIKKVNEKSEKE